jgi:hypothetical protein
MTPPSNPLNDDTLTRWIDNELPAKEASLLNQRASATPELLREREAASQLGELLRQHLPAKLDPPSPEFFTMSVMDEVTRDLPARPVEADKSRRVPAWLSFLRTPWFSPLASAAVVAVAFLTWNHFSGTTGGGSVAQSFTYAPDPSVVANTYYSQDAEATVIDLQHLAPVPNEREIKAFDVASSGPSIPGQPTVFVASNDPKRVVFVLSKDGIGAPRVASIR